MYHPSLENLNNLQELNLRWVQKLQSCPSLGNNIMDLRILKIQSDEVESLPSLGYFENLIELYVGGSKLESFPDD